jgi:hypothetical protein
MGLNGDFRQLNSSCESGIDNGFPFPRVLNPPYFIGCPHLSLVILHAIDAKWGSSC